MASRVNVGVQRYNMPSNIYEMSKDAQKSSIPGVIGSIADKLGTAMAARMAAERIAEDQANQNQTKLNYEEANKLASSGEYTKPNYDEAYNLEFGEISEDDKTYDPFKKDDPFISDDIRYLGDELFVG